MTKAAYEKVVGKLQSAIPTRDYHIFKEMSQKYSSYSYIITYYVFTRLKALKKCNESWQFTTFLSERETKYQTLKIFKESFHKYKLEISFT